VVALLGEIREQEGVGASPAGKIVGAETADQQITARIAFQRIGMGRANDVDEIGKDIAASSPARGSALQIGRRSRQIKYELGLSPVSSCESEL